MQWRAIPGEGILGEGIQGAGIPIGAIPEYKPGGMLHESLVRFLYLDGPDDNMPATLVRAQKRVKELE